MSSSTLGRGLTLALFLSLPLAAQPLAGGYTIDNLFPTSGANFTSFIDAAAALAANGVSGPVSFVVANNGTPYAGFSIVAAIAGASSTNTISFTGVGRPVISGVATGFVQTVRLGTAAVATAGGPTDLVFDNFEITGAPSGAAFIATQCDRIVIRNCAVHTSGSGICFNASRNCVAEDNELYAVGNTVGAPGSATYSGAITAYYNANNITIQRNKIHDCTGNGIHVGSSGSTTAPLNSVVVNNFIWNTPGAGSYTGGISLRRAGNGVIANNSIWMPAGSANAGLNYTGGASADPRPQRLQNNIIKHDGTGACFRIEATTTIVAGVVIEDNVYEPGPGGNLAQVAAVNVTSLAAWQTYALPAMTGLEVNTIVGAIGFAAPNDLHILPSSPAFNSGATVAEVSLDIDLQSRPIGGLPDRGADEAPASGLFAGFLASPVAGSVPLTVVFTDNSYTSAAGITSWGWDFQNDGIIDSTLQNPSYTYTCPGTYSVSLTVTDGVNPNSTLVRTNLVSVGGFVFDIATTGGGVADLVITPVPTTCGQALGAASGYTLISLATTLPVGSGPAFGLVPDAATFTFLFTPAAPGNLIHFNVAPPLYPDGGSLAF